MSSIVCWFWLQCTLHVVPVVTLHCLFLFCLLSFFIIGKLQDGNMENSQNKGNNASQQSDNLIVYFTLTSLQHSSDDPLYKKKLTTEQLFTNTLQFFSYRVFIFHLCCKYIWWYSLHQLDFVKNLKCFETLRCISPPLSIILTCFGQYLKMLHFGISYKYRFAKYFCLYYFHY